MIDTLFTDAAVRSAAAQLRPDRDAADVIARAAWSVVAEPGDGVAGALIAHLGPEAALKVGLGEARARRGSSQSGAPGLSDDSARAVREGRARWRPRARHAAVLDALQGAADIGARALFPGDECWPARLDDLALHAPVMLWVRGDADALSATRAIGNPRYSSWRYSVSENGVSVCSISPCEGQSQTSVMVSSMCPGSSGWPQAGQSRPAGRP